MQNLTLEYIENQQFVDSAQSAFLQHFAQTLLENAKPVSLYSHNFAFENKHKLVIDFCSVDEKLSNKINNI